MVTDSTPMWHVGGGAGGEPQSAAAVAPARDQRVALEVEQIAQYWQRCDRMSRGKLSHSHSASDTLVSDEDEDDEEGSSEDGDVECEFDEGYVSEYDVRYMHYSRRSSRGTPFVSGLPLLCGNCGVSFFSLRSVEHEDDCYCSGECKWSVIMYQEMDRRMHSMRSSRARAAHPTS